MDVSQIGYDETALKNLAKLPRKAQIRMVKKIEALLNTNTRHLKLRGEQSGRPPIYRVRSGDYRALYTIKENSQIVVLDIGHRREIYRKK